MSGLLYVVGTPIGNLGDFSPRGAETLQQVDFIAAEDTRVTIKLLNHLGIKKPMISYYEHNRREKGQLIVERILAGESCALVTDAGMPAISDPGEDLVALCHESGVTVASVPGPTAFATALALSGLPVGRFTFEGFLSVNKKNRAAHLQGLQNERRTLVFYEAPHKLANTLKDLFNVLGDRRLAIVREITKLHEQVIRTTLAQAVRQYGQGGLKGEIVLVIEGTTEAETPVSWEETMEMAVAFTASGLSVNEAAREAAKGTPFKKNEIYKALLGQDDSGNDQSTGKEEKI